MILALACLSAALLTFAVCTGMFARTALAVAQDERKNAASDRARHAATIDMLCQRIQAPDTATARYELEQTDGSMPQPPPLDDDKAYWEARQENQLGQPTIDREAGA